MTIQPVLPTMPETVPETVIAYLQHRAATDPDRPAFIWLHDGEIASRQITYGELDRHARSIAARLSAAAERGSRALLLYEPGLDYTAAFFGCLYAGIIAVPAYLPPIWSPRRTPRRPPRRARCRSRPAVTWPCCSTHRARPRRPKA
jgi:acyl-CoA synthetase (AMP-forming)/AMP-acid ligase II